MKRKGEKVKVTPHNNVVSWPASAWIPVGGEEVTLLEDSPHRGTLDVVNVLRANGDQESIYDFDIAEPFPDDAEEGCGIECLSCGSLILPEQADTAMGEGNPMCPRCANKFDS
jgi:hypothetical protein